MKQLSTAALLAFLLVFPTAVLAGQEPVSSIQLTAFELVLKDGSRLYGTTVSETPEELVFRTTSGAIIRTGQDRILSLRPVVGRIIGGEFRREDPNNTRLLFGPTGRALAKGQVYLGVYEVSMPFVQIGLTDRISVGGGTPLMFGFAGSERPFWVTPKVQLMSSGNVHVAAGLFHGFNVSGDGLGIAYAVVTRDGERGSGTAGIGMGYTSEGGRGAVAMAGADASLRRNMKLITENYLWNSGAVASLGVRFFGDNLSADLALGIVFLRDGVLGAPVVNFVYRF
jgi:hypothetical protein